MAESKEALRSLIAAVSEDSSDEEGMVFNNSAEYTKTLTWTLDFLNLIKELVTSSQEPGWPLPDFYCPISKKLMTDPVIISSGETFEREAINKWFGDGNTTCPLTHVQLDDFTLTPNLLVKELMAQYSTAAAAFAASTSSV